MSGYKVIASAAATALRMGLPPMSREEQEDALAAVAAEANKRIEGKLADELGSLFIARRRAQDDPFNGLIIASKPLPNFGGASFWLNTGSSGGDLPPFVLVHDVPAAAALFCENRENVARIAREVSTIADEIIVRGSDVQPPMKLVPIGITAADSIEDYRVMVTVEALGHGLVSGPEFINVSFSKLSELRDSLEALSAVHSKRAQMLAQHKAECTVGLIDLTALRKFSRYHHLHLACWRDLFVRLDTNVLRGRHSHELVRLHVGRFFSRQGSYP